jgi:hypothetical protein
MTVFHLPPSTCNVNSVGQLKDFASLLLISPSPARSSSDLPTGALNGPRAVRSHCNHIARDACQKCQFIRICRARRECKPGE